MFQFTWHSIYWQTQEKEDLIYRPISMKVDSEGVQVNVCSLGKQTVIFYIKFSL